MSERIPTSSNSEIHIQEGAEQYTTDAPASPEQMNIAEDFVREAGANPKGVDYSVQIVKNEDGTFNARSGWVIKKGDKASLQEGEDAPLFERTEVPVIKSTRPRTTMRNKRRNRTALIVPDIQMGYRRIDGELVPLHDEQALEVAYMLARYIQPDEIVFNGDNLDLPNLSTHGPDPAARGLLTENFQSAVNMLSQFRADVSDAKMTYISGNHEDRWFRYIANNAPELAGLRRPALNGEKKLGRLALELGWMLRSDELEVNVLDGYPANKYWLNDRLKVIHGVKVNSRGSTAATVLNDDSHSSTIYGHIHRMEAHSKTITGSRGVPRTVSAHSFGTLARIDGGIPSFGWARDLSQATVENYENWQQGVGLVEFDEGDRPFSVTPIPIHTHDGYLAMFDGKDFLPQKGTTTLQRAA